MNVPKLGGRNHEGFASANVQRAGIHFDMVEMVLTQALVERGVMSLRVRHCVECPKCFTRYLIASSPYRNGSYIVPAAPYLSEDFTLYCTCGKPTIASWWRWGELMTCKVSTSAHDRGYGTPQEIVPTRGEARGSGSLSRKDLLDLELLGEGNPNWLEDLLR